jgi:hypothetical protein
MSVEVNEIDFMALKQLINKRDKLKREEKQFYDHESPQKYLDTRKQRKQTEKQIFKLIKQL